MVKIRRRGGEMPMTNDALIKEINSAFRHLSAATEDLVRADHGLAEHVRVRLDNAEAILEEEQEDSEPLPLRPARH
jgi:hypothetical protein